MKYNASKLIFVRDANNWSDKFFAVLAVIAILASAFHFWPCEDNKIWQIINVPNICCVAVLVLAAFFLVSKKLQGSISLYIPHSSILAYLAINILSISIADNLSRPLNYTIKLCLVFIGGVFLFQKAMAKPKTLRIFYVIASVAVSISISFCIYTRFVFGPEQFGFYSNALKYGTYLGIIVPLCSMYLLSGSKAQIFLAILITTASIFSAGSAGVIISIFVGLIAGCVLSRKSSVKIYVCICLMLALAVLPLSNKVFGDAVRSDLALKENDGVNLRQRYIEWQAEINLLEKRGISGTGAGCVNDYRSNFYYRLPKLNTLKVFDQNGFLAVGAETGLLGFVTFVWILICYGKMSFNDYRYFKTGENKIASAMTVANTAAFISTLTVNLFSSVHYNGILIVFVFLLSLISSVNRIYGAKTNED